MFSALLGLRDLLATIFSPDELRMILHLELGSEGVSLASSLPGEKASAQMTAYHTVVILDNHGLIDQDLFALLIRKRPHRRAEIEGVARQFEVTNSPKPGKRGAKKQSFCVARRRARDPPKL